MRIPVGLATVQARRVFTLTGLSAFFLIVRACKGSQLGKTGILASKICVRRSSVDDGSTLRYSRAADSSLYYLIGMFCFCSVFALPKMSEYVPRRKDKDTVGR